MSLHFSVSGERAGETRHAGKVRSRTNGDDAGCRVAEFATSSICTGRSAFAVLIRRLANSRPTLQSPRQRVHSTS